MKIKTYYLGIAIIFGVIFCLVTVGNLVYAIWEVDFCQLFFANSKTQSDAYFWLRGFSWIISFDLGALFWILFEISNAGIKL